MRANSGKRAEKPSGIGAFRAKSGDFHFFDGSTVLTEVGRPMRVRTVAAPVSRPTRSAGSEKNLRKPSL
jgi:hypothetical protein